LRWSNEGCRLSKKNQTQKNKMLRTSEDTSNKKMFYLKIAMFILSGAIMIGHGARMMYQGLFQPTSYYPAPTPFGIDFYFDWLTLSILGIAILIYALFTFYHQIQRNHKRITI
jgi:hypothetical protein